jgi:hypothetical protein
LLDLGLFGGEPLDLLRIVAEDADRLHHVAHLSLRRQLRQLDVLLAFGKSGHDPRHGGERPDHAA